MPWQVRLSLKLPTVPALPNAGLTRRIRQRFALEAGQVIVLAVQNQLGTDALYRLDPGYAARKPKLRGYRRLPGKDPDQPGILTAEMMYHLAWRATAEGVEVQVADGFAMDAGFDYAQFQEELMHYLEAGLDTVEDQLPLILEDIIMQEMNL